MHTHHSLESTTDLVERVKRGEQEALDRLFTRQLPALRRWARGRLPRRMRDLQDTDDLVQGLKRHWLLRSAFKTKETSTPAGSAAPVESPKGKSLK